MKETLATLQLIFEPVTRDAKFPEILEMGEKQKGMSFYLENLEGFEKLLQHI